MASLSDRTKPNVLIVGGGLGGLSLAQTLRAQGIPFDVFERDSSKSARPQGWAITLRDRLIEDLVSSMPNDMPQLEPVGHLYEHGILCEGAVFDASNQTMTEVRRFGPEHGNHMIRANRDRLRGWLLTGLEGKIHWNKNFSRFEETAEGITVRFADDTSYQGDILVGADGIGSKVRDQLFHKWKDVRPQNVALGAILGEVTATKEQYQRWMSPAKSYYSCVAGDLRMTVALKCISPDAETAEFYWLYGWKDEGAREDDFWTTTASKKELHDFVLARLDGVQPIFAEIMRATPVEGMLHPPLRLKDMTPPQLPPGCVTLIGDACHPMLPFRGQGGHMAMKDATSLGGLIGNNHGQRVDQVLKNFEVEMRPRTEEMVLASRAAATTAKAA